MKGNRRCVHPTSTYTDEDTSKVKASNRYIASTLDFDCNEDAAKRSLERTMRRQHVDANVQHRTSRQVLKVNDSGRLERDGVRIFHSRPKRNIQSGRTAVGPTLIGARAPHMHAFWGILRQMAKVPRDRPYNSKERDRSSDDTKDTTIFACASNSCSHHTASLFSFCCTDTRGTRRYNE